MTRTQLAILPFGFASFWLGKAGHIADIDGIVIFLAMAIFIYINIFIEQRKE